MAKCSQCRYCKTIKYPNCNEYRCTHQDIEESAEEYEVRQEKRISKDKNMIGYVMPKTALRWCPLNRR